MKKPVFQGGNGRERGFVHTTLLHLAIRMRHLLTSWFFLKPLLQTELTDYPSFLRPKDIPKLDWPTAFAIRMLWLAGTHVRDKPRLAGVLVKLQAMRVLTWCHEKLMVSALPANLNLHNHSQI